MEHVGGGNTFVRAFLAPQLIILSTTLLALFGLFVMMVRDQNATSLANEQAQVERGIADRLDYVSANIRDYTRWDDAVDHLTVDFDREWADANIGPYLYNLQGYDANFVVDSDGSTVYASRDGGASPHDAAQYLGPALPDLIDGLAKVDSEQNYAALTTIQGKPAILVADRIMPSVGSDFATSYPPRTMIIAQHLDEGVLDRVAETYGLHSLEFGPAGEDQAAYTIKSGAGAALAAVRWTPSRPGSAMLSRFLPWLILIAVNALIMSLMMLKRARAATINLAMSEAKAVHLAHHDTLTGLPNRRALLAHGARIDRSKTPLSLLYLDLDGFKEVNDLFGHQAGDVLLREATDRLRTVVGRHGYLTRLGGDEFAVLLIGGESREMVTAMADRIVEALAMPFKANQIDMVVSASVGIAMGEAQDDVEELVRLADIAMYAAKNEGRNGWRIYGPEMSEGRELRKRLESELRASLSVGEVDVFFQPIVDARSGKTVCLEALARWSSPSEGPVGPAIFVPIAEESGLIVELGRHILRRACTEARDWDINIAVNLSPAQFWHQGIAGEILAVLKECDFPPERLELEITEGYLISRPDLAVTIIRELRSNGINIALDDFGTGFASIGYLRRFELDKIKLDRSFVEMVDENVDSAMVAQAVIALSKSFKLPISAEGVETEGQAVMLKVAGCDRLQGWRFGYPEAAGDLSPRHTHPNRAPVRQVTAEPTPAPSRRSA